ncbi:MAG: type II toxin-antitoxin system HicB family antitoxin [Desulfitobacteriaceae bacterium]|nr:type II toxin-antitoxin system HicB family antitoxin [Clostridia bacterium]MDD4346356.1 type II toxin-antitoxin system HicB family antitoxin [Desulfitobacteriaceae bacterium]
MRKITYFAVFEPSVDGTFGVYFPDLPGCISIGDNFQHAQGMANEALGLHLWGMEKDNDSIPVPAQPPFNNIPTGSIIVPITVFPEFVKDEMDNRSVKTNITLPAWLKDLAEKHGVNFSQITQAALKEYLGVDRP